MASKALLKEERFQLSPKNVFTESGKEESRNVYDTTHSVQFSRSVVSDSLRPHEPQHIRPPCPTPTPGISKIFLAKRCPSHYLVFFPPNIIVLPGSANCGFYGLLGP